MIKFSPFHKSSPNTAESSILGNGSQESTKRAPRANCHHPFTEDGIRKRAQQIYEKRVAVGLVGTPEGDWNQAIRELCWEQSRLGRFYQWTGLGQKKGWDLLTTLSLPILLFAGGSLFTYWNNQQQQRVAVENRKQDLQLADDKIKQDTLVRYLDQMADSLKDGLLNAPPISEKFIIAQSRTVTALLSLDKKRQQLIIQFLTASGFNQARQLKFDDDDTIQLGQQDRVLLYKAQMKKANFANSDLSGAALVGADLWSANFGCVPPETRNPDQCSDLRWTNLVGAYLISTNFSGAYLEHINLQGADLWKANLSDTFIEGAHLERANLVYTNLRGARGWNDEQISKAWLCHTKLPEGSKLDPDRDCPSSKK